jgi:predicted nucleic acid-binding protein
MLVDSSAWIEFLRGTGSDIAFFLKDAISQKQLATTDAVVMEVLAGARTDHEWSELGALLGMCQMIPSSTSDFLDASNIIRHSRMHGETIRRSADCLIAAVAVRADIPILHVDRDYEVIARHSSLKLVSLS